MYRMRRLTIVAAAGAASVLVNAACQDSEANRDLQLDVVPKSEWGRSDVIHVLVPGYPEPTNPVAFTLLTEEMTGVSFVETNEMVGSISLVSIRDEPLEGREFGEFSSGTCAPWISFNPTNSIHFSHMLGHSIGLEHSDDPCNFMYGPNGWLETECPTEFEANDEQVDELRAYAWALENVCDEFR